MVGVLASIEVINLAWPGKKIEDVKKSVTKNNVNHEKRRPIQLGAWVFCRGPV